jgi:glutathione S-transferase
MTAHIHDLVLADGRRLSPYCWAAKLALAHKGVPFQTTPTRFIDIPNVAAGGFKTVPVIELDSVTIGDSFELALHLERTRPDAPALFAGEGGVALTRFVAAQAAYLLGKMSRPMVVAIHDALDGETQAYFRASRERMFRASLEDVAADPDSSVAAAHEALKPLRILLKAQPFLGGEDPMFADFLIAGLVQWSRVVGAVDFLDGEKAIADWFARIDGRHGAVLAAVKG